MLKVKKPRKPSLKACKKKLWVVFSQYIRQRDKYICISCGKTLNKLVSQAGHYIPKTAGLSIYFDERNVNCQCIGCNCFRHGNLSAYAVAMRAKYGPNILEELDAKRRQFKKYTVMEYQQLIAYYSALIL